ncbi:MAG: 30S ribosomal protein S16 [Deltaproteobacteria bacterium]|nr:30S ribosomal protein S16 [Deltaproteobacteria bacterium]MCL5277324.1 30S ribosomal protein S16 [Deltaproteobacteria bacterium]
MVAIRLKKFGRKHIQQYRIVVEDSRYTAGGRVLEVLGNFSPATKPYTIKVDADKIKAWISKGAQLSPRVRTLLEAQKLV